MDSFCRESITEKGENSAKIINFRANTSTVGANEALSEPASSSTKDSSRITSLMGTVTFNFHMEIAMTACSKQANTTEEAF